MTTELSEISEELQSFEKSQKKPEIKWFVFYTCPRAEKVAYQELVRREFDVFLPITRTLKVWKNRQKKWIDQVLFPGYIFVNTNHHQLFDIKRIPKIVTYIHVAGVPATIPLKEIEGIKTILNLNQAISVETEFSEGEKVRIIYGPLAGHTGILLRQKGRTRFGIQLKEINHTVFIDICVKILEKI